MSLFKNKNYPISVSIELDSSLKRPSVCAFNTGAGPNLERAGVLDTSWLDSIYHRDVQNICSAPDPKLKVSGTINVHLHIGFMCTVFNFGVISELVFLGLSGTAYIDRFTKSIRPTEREIVPYRSPPEAILMVHKVVREAEMKRSGTYQAGTKYLALLMTPTTCDPKYITVARQVVFTAVCQTSSLISPQAVVLKEVGRHKSVANDRACMTANGIMDVYPGSTFNITTANPGKVDVNLPEHRIVGEVASPPQEIVHANDIRFS